MLHWLKWRCIGFSQYPQDLWNFQNTWKPRRRGWDVVHAERSLSSLLDIFKALEAGSGRQCWQVFPYSPAFARCFSDYSGILLATTSRRSMPCSSRSRRLSTWTMAWGFTNAARPTPLCTTSPWLCLLWEPLSGAGSSWRWLIQMEFSRISSKLYQLCPFITHAHQSCLLACIKWCF